MRTLSTRFLVFVLCLRCAAPLGAQTPSISTNLLDWANLGTLNVQAGVSVSRHLSLQTGVRYNPWRYGSPERGNALQNCARTVSAGMRWWPWNVYSSWWVGSRAIVEEYNRGGLFGRQLTEEGVAAGVSIGAGYSRMLAPHWNLDLGLGLWGGRARYTQYRCPRCGRVVSSGATAGEPVSNRSKWFIQPSDDVQVSLIYVF
ncbi:MAG: DUF3575 domain-containing protein [Bacteroidales bacterium]|nr:DUF3575 domain-containing protein [Bacteroidales bacterium]